MFHHVSDHKGSIIRELYTVMDPLSSETCWSNFKLYYNNSNCIYELYICASAR